MGINGWTLLGAQTYAAELGFFDLDDSLSTVIDEGVYGMFHNHDYNW